MYKIGAFTAVVATIAGLMLPIVPSVAQQAAGPVCTGLASQWRGVEMELAAIYSEGITDDSAPRATMRASRAGVEMARANAILTLMASYKCTMPKSAPSEVTYLAKALECSTEQLKGNYKSEACDRTKWTPSVPTP